jgi:hypothetical protein
MTQIINTSAFTSNSLQQAILDAEQIRDIAIANAKSSLQGCLEQEKGNRRTRFLTIENINIINSKFAGTPEWQIGEIFIGEQNYVFQIHKRVGEWRIEGVKHSELTVKLNRVKAIDGYVMETGLIRQNYYSRSAHSIDSMRDMTSFLLCLDKHIREVVG